MKKILTAFLLIIAISETSLSQPVWTFQNSGTTSNLNRIKVRYISEKQINSNQFSIKANTSSKQLDANNISAWFKNNGNFNRHPVTGNAGFQWPRPENLFARYTSGLQLGGIVNGDTLVVICNYSYEFFPGFTNLSGIPQGNGSPEYKVYKITYEHNDSDRYNWPNALLGNSDQGAPVYFDPISSTYKPNDFANQTMFYSYTDSYPESHSNPAGSTAPLKADIKQINFAFNQPEELKNVIYQEYRIINRSNNIWQNFYINIYTDDDIGCAAFSDGGSVDSVSQISYTYKRSSTDPCYGSNPPAVGFAVIRSPLIYTGNNSDTIYYYEGTLKRIKVGYGEIGLNSTAIFGGDTWEPRNYRESYNTLQGLIREGTPFINPITNQQTKFVYSGDPVTNSGWVQQTGDDMRFYQGFGPMNMNPGDTQVIVVAQVIARGSSNLNSITKLREATITAKQYYDNCFEGITIGVNNISQNIPDKFTLHQNFPNPFNPSTRINFSIPKRSFVKLNVYDITGRLVKTLANETLDAGEYSVTLEGGDLPSGIYFYRIEAHQNGQAGNFSETKKMIMVK